MDRNGIRMDKKRRWIGKDRIMDENMEWIGSE